MVITHTHMHTHTPYWFCVSGEHCLIPLPGKGKEYWELGVVLALPLTSWVNLVSL